MSHAIKNQLVKSFFPASYPDQTDASPLVANGTQCRGCLALSRCEFGEAVVYCRRNKFTSTIFLLHTLLTIRIFRDCAMTGHFECFKTFLDIALLVRQKIVIFPFAQSSPKMTSNRPESDFH